jgi:hypothetical protein
MAGSNIPALQIMSIAKQATHVQQDSSSMVAPDDRRVRSLVACRAAGRIRAPDIPCGNNRHLSTNCCSPSRCSVAESVSAGGVPDG